MSILLNCIEIIKALGLPAIVFIIWYYDHKKINGLQEITKNYEKITEDLSNLIILNVQNLSRMEQKIDDNKFCPIIRKELEHEG
ncbi:MAG: hypothetical protein SV375_11370 [Thermodesulfobacteriota bacterium]|nr:hypothetical protein [Thermodesulfobacteriota bacterium]